MGYGEEEHEEVIGKHHSIFVCEDYAKSPEYEKFWDILRSGKYYQGEFERRKKMEVLLIFKQLIILFLMRAVRLPK